MLQLLIDHIRVHLRGKENVMLSELQFSWTGIKKWLSTCFQRAGKLPLKATLHIHVFLVFLKHSLDHLASWY